jgi:hypothetical protein
MIIFVNFFRTHPKERKKMGKLLGFVHGLSRALFSKMVAKELSKKSPFKIVRVSMELKSALGVLRKNTDDVPLIQLSFVFTIPFSIQ